MQIDRRLVSHFDWALLLMTFGFVAIGIATIYSANFSANAGHAGALPSRQALWLGLGLIAMISHLPEMLPAREGTAHVLRNLPPIEEKIIRMRFGIGHDREHTLEEVAQDIGLTRERIRQIEVKALQRLRSPENTRRLGPLLSVQ